MKFTEKIEKRINLTAIIKIYNINWTRIKLNQTEKLNYLEGKNLSLLLIITTKLYCYHSVIINVIEINRNHTLIVLQKYGSM